jgi:hypothetical protein
MNKIFKSIIAASLAVLTSYSVHAQEFLCVSLENTTPEVLNKTLEKSGAKLVKNKSNKLVNIYVFKHSLIPGATNAATYWNEKGEWVGLRVGFEYNQYENLGLRKNLVQKYGSPTKIVDFFGEKNEVSLFTKEHFFDKAYWNIGNVRLDFDANNFTEKLKVSDDPWSDNREGLHISFKHIERSKELTNKVGNKIDEVNKEKWKGVF